MNKNGPHRLLVRGESTVASVGLALAAIMLIAMAGASWWMSATHRQAERTGHLERTRAAATVLAASAESLAGAGRISELRVLLQESGRVFDLSNGQLVLPDGRIVADLNAGRIDALELPATWDGRPATEPTETITDASILIDHPIIVPGRGPMSLRIEAETSGSETAAWRAHAGAGIIGAVALLAVLATYRWLRARLRPMAVMRDALLGMGENQPRADLLTLRGESGELVDAWNRLVGELDRLRIEDTDRRARSSLECRRRSNVDLESAWDALWQGMVLIDEQLNVTHSNGAAAILLGVQRDSMASANFTELLDDEDVIALMRSIAAGEIRQRRTVEIERDNDGRSSVLRFTLRPVRKDDAASAMIVIEDITQQRVADAARNAFVAQATHELRTPLTNIRLYVESAIEDGEDDPEQRAKCLNVINTESRRLERIVADMLSVSEIEAGSLSVRQDDVRLDALFEELHSDYQAQADEREIKLVFELPPKLPVIQGDRDKITLALHNLLGNSLKYTPVGGEVTVTVEVESSQVSVHVSDNGIGIPSDDHERVFDKFYRVKDKRVAGITGTGLGLALAREVVRLHGGDITLESEVDRGSTFTVSLPALVEAA